MNTLKQCVELNTQAIMCMREGRFVESSLMLHNALEKLEGCMAAPQMQPQQQTYHNHHHHHHHSHAPSHPASPVTVMDDPILDAHDQTRKGQGGCTYTSVSVESQSTQAMVKKASPENIFSFYPRMFHVTYEGQINSMELMKITLIVMFNEALSRHAIALQYLSQYKVNPEKHLTMILGLYQKIVLLARNCFQFDDVSEMLCVLVAATNNYGHIASQLLLFNETRDSINNIIQLLAISNENSFLQDDVRLFFESVCIFLEGRQLRNAPAA